MTHVPHELAEEFPDHRDTIHRLKTSNGHFARLFDEYHGLNREIHRHEANGIDVADEVIEGWKKQRLKLKDELFAMIAGA